ncbi:MAG: phosphoribosylglycinamide formyltransferase [Synergistaceae bacterium]|jgi:formyltetrahydrofolate-dependent phosphoribosylglycinamide formyltransferase|nr:phosphoribosylglycinamide formyltransferase [Synergistaceae bacterium]
MTIHPAQEAKARQRVAILISGNGTNMVEIVHARKRGALDADIALVISDNPNAPGLGKAKKLGCRTFVAEYAAGAPREENERSIVEAIEQNNVDWIVLAGFMRILSASFVRRFPGRIVNIHPSLLPAFPGAHAIKDAFEAGADITGVTIHIVDELVDHGPIIAQEEVPVLPGDTLETLETRIHATEHALYPKTLQALFTEDI